MPPAIRPYHAADMDDLLALTVLAFAPIFASFASLLGPRIYAALYPDWQTVQRDLVRELCADPASHVWVAAHAGQAVGLVAYRLDEAKRIGEIELLVVHPQHQRAGIGTRLIACALTNMREAGMHLAELGTGSDDAHAPARSAYEQAGFHALPLVRYFKHLT